MTLTKLSVRPQSPDVITQTVSDNFVGPARVVRRESRVWYQQHRGQSPPRPTPAASLPTTVCVCVCLFVYSVPVCLCHHIVWPNLYFVVFEKSVVSVQLIWQCSVAPAARVGDCHCEEEERRRRNRFQHHWSVISITHIQRWFFLWMRGISVQIVDFPYFQARSILNSKILPVLLSFWYGMTVTWWKPFAPRRTCFFSDD